MQPHKATCIEHSGCHLVSSLKLRSVVEAVGLDERFCLLDGCERGVEASRVAVAHAGHGVAVHDQRTWASICMHYSDHALHLSHKLILIIDKVSTLAKDKHLVLVQN